MTEHEWSLETLPPRPELERDGDELPLKVVPDWDEQVQRATVMCRLVDRHLDAEAGGRILHDRRDFRPEHLCPEQRVQMVSDLYGATRQG